MDISFFFDGKLSREEAASAFLAILLDQISLFRYEVFMHMGMSKQEARGLASLEWRTYTEKNDIDIMLECISEKIALLVEVKVLPGAKEHGQLQRYCKIFRATYPDWRLLVLYVAPEAGLGTSEVESIVLGREEYAETLSWTQAHEMLVDLEELAQGDRQFVDSGFNKIFYRIEDNKRTKHPLIGERILSASMISKVNTSLNDRCNGRHKFCVWRWPNEEVVYLTDTKVSIEGKITFGVKNDLDHEPDILRENGMIEVAIRLQFKISSKGKRDPEVRQWWNSLSVNRHGDSTLSSYTLDRNGWYFLEKPLCDSPEVIVTQLIEGVSDLLEATNYYL